LYGFDLAKDSIRQTRSCVMVEGQMDCIMSYQAGVKNVVAVSGTALTEEHLAMIGRLAESIIFAFDADQAGQKAAARGIGMCIEQGFDVRIAEIPAGSDPADIVAKDPAGWRKCVDAAAPVLEHYISGIQDGQSAREARQYVQKSVLPLIARLSSHIEQARHINSIATRLGIREDAVWTDLEAIHEAEKSRKETGGSDAGVTHEKQVAGKRERIEGALVGLLEWQGRLNEKSSHTKQVLGRYEKLVGGQDMSLIKRLPQETIDMLAIRAEREYAEQADNLPEIIDELCVRLEKELLRDSRERLAHQADIARTQGLEEEENKFLDEVRTLTERIQKLDTEEGPPA
jgi:DNA primase